MDCIGEELPVNEAVGEDIRCDEDGVWRGVVKEGNGKNGRGWAVSAGPLEHRGEFWLAMLEYPCLSCRIHPIGSHS